MALSLTLTPQEIQNTGCSVTAANGPGQRNSSRRATVCCANTRKRGIAQAANIRVRFEDWPLACLAWTQCGLAKCELSLARKRASHVVTAASSLGSYASELTSGCQMFPGRLANLP